MSQQAKLRWLVGQVVEEDRLFFLGKGQTEANGQVDSSEQLLLLRREFRIGIVFVELVDTSAADIPDFRSFGSTENDSLSDF